MELATWLGLALGFGGILLGNFLEGGSIGALIQGTAAFIVFGGTFGAVLVASRTEDLRVAGKIFPWIWKRDFDFDPHKLSAEIIQVAQLARKETLLAVEAKLPTLSSEFLRRALRLCIDNVDPKIVREILETEVHVEEERLMAGARVWSDAGGYSPTIGIIGAVLGLIAVMSHLTDTSQLGKGIAVAFVATIYGVASANLLFLPISQKLKRKIKLNSNYKHMVIEGVMALAQGISPTLIRDVVHPFLETEKSV